MRHHLVKWKQWQVREQTGNTRAGQQHFKTGVAAKRDPRESGPLTNSNFQCQTCHQVPTRPITMIRSITLILLTSVANIPGRSTLRASSCGNLVVPWTHRRIDDRAFSVSAPRAWNRLPTELKLLRSTDLFRQDLKTFLFHSVYGHQDTD